MGGVPNLHLSLPSPFGDALSQFIAAVFGKAFRRRCSSLVAIARLGDLGFKFLPLKVKFISIAFDELRVEGKYRTLNEKFEVCTSHIPAHTGAKPSSFHPSTALKLQLRLERPPRKLPAQRQRYPTRRRQRNCTKKRI